STRASSFSLVSSSRARSSRACRSSTVMGRACAFIELSARMEGGSCSPCWAGSSVGCAIASVAIAVEDAPRNSRRVGMPYYTAMPLHRVSVLGGTDPQARAEFLEAAGAAGMLLASEGITLLYDSSSPGPRAELIAAFQAAHGMALQVAPEQL